MSVSVLAAFNSARQNNDLQNANTVSWLDHLQQGDAAGVVFSELEKLQSQVGSSPIAADIAYAKELVVEHGHQETDQKNFVLLTAQVQMHEAEVREEQEEDEDKNRLLQGEELENYRRTMNERADEDHRLAERAENLREKNEQQHVDKPKVYDQHGREVVKGNDGHYYYADTILSSAKEEVAGKDFEYIKKQEDAIIANGGKMETEDEHKAYQQNGQHWATAEEKAKEQEGKDRSAANKDHPTEGDKREADKPQPAMDSLRSDIENGENAKDMTSYSPSAVSQVKDRSYSKNITDGDNPLSRIKPALSNSFVAAVNNEQKAPEKKTNLGSEVAVQIPQNDDDKDPLKQLLANNFENAAANKIAEKSLNQSDNPLNQFKNLSSINSIQPNS